MNGINDTLKNFSLSDQAILFQNELSKKLPPIREETVLGEAAVLQVFHLTGSRKAVVAGCRVKKGSLAGDSLYRVIRNGEVLYEGESL